MGNPKNREISLASCCSIRVYNAIHNTDAPARSVETRIFTLVDLALLSVVEDPSSSVSGASTVGSAGTVSSATGSSTDGSSTAGVSTVGF